METTGDEPVAVSRSWLFHFAHDNARLTSSSGNYVNTIAERGGADEMIALMATDAGFNTFDRGADADPAPSIRANALLRTGQTSEAPSGTRASAREEVRAI